MKLKTIALATLLATLTFGAVSCGKIIKINTVKDNVSRDVTVTAPFNSIMTEATADVVYTRSDKTAVTVSAPASHIDYITVSVQNGTLVISQRDNRMLSNTIGSAMIKVTVSAPDVTRFTTGGTGDFEIQQLAGDSIYLFTSGTGDFEIGKIESSHITAQSVGTGDIDISDLLTGSAELSTQGTGDISVSLINATQLSAITDGTGDISFGGGKVNSAIFSANGSGDINYNKVKINNIKK